MSFNKNWEFSELSKEAFNASRPFSFKDYPTAVFINTGDVLLGKFLHSTISCGKELPGQAKKALQKNDILLTEIRPANGRFAFVDFDVKNYVVSTKFMVIESRGRVLPRFLYHVLVNQISLNEFQRIAESRSGTFPQITFDSIAHFPVPVPPIAEQINLVHFFDAIQARLDLLKETNTTLEAIAQALFKSWFVDFDPVRAKQEGREPEGMDADTAALFPDSFEESEQGLIPKGWEVGCIGDFSCVKGGFAYKSIAFCDKGFPVVKIKNIVGDGTVDLLDTQFISDEMASKTTRFALKDADVVIAMTGATIGKTGIIVTKGDEIPYLNQRVAKFEPNIHGQDNGWLVFIAFQNSFISDQVVNNASGSAQPNISTTGIESVRLIIPKNHVLLDVFNETVTPLFQNWIANHKQSQTITEIRDTLLPRLISGQLRIPEAEALIEESTV